MASTLRACQEQDIPTVLTLHAVGAEPAPPEHFADVLAATTRRSEQRLRARHPHKQVTYLPHGCPRWLPKRKAKAGRAVSAYAPSLSEGDLRSLASSLERAGAELLMFGEAAPRPPGRYVPGDFPSAEVAARLAAEADVLVYWYGETGCADVDGVVRAGLATGVPVLTSRGVAFEDVREAVYQADELTEGVARLLEDTDLRAHVTASAREFCIAHGWGRVASAHEALWESLTDQRSHRP